MRIVIVDDDDIVLMSLKMILEANDVEVVATGKNGEDAVKIYEQYLPDILLSDIRMSGKTGIDAAYEITNRYPEARILFLTTFSDDEYVIAALKCHARGYILKQDFESILPSIRAVYSGQSVFGGEIINKIPSITKDLARDGADVDTQNAAPTNVEDGMDAAGGTNAADGMNAAGGTNAADGTNAAGGTNVEDGMNAAGETNVEDGMNAAGGTNAADGTNAKSEASASVGTRMADMFRMAEIYEQQGITEKEYEIIALAAEGYNNREIAAKLFLSEGTVRNYVSSILDKLQLRDRTQLVVYYYKHSYPPI